MITRDMFGTLFSEGDIVAFSLGLAQMIPAKVSKITSGLDNNRPLVFLEVSLPLDVTAQGVVPGLVVLKVEDKPKVIEP